MRSPYEYGAVNLALREMPDLHFFLLFSLACLMHHGCSLLFISPLLSDYLRELIAPRRASLVLPAKPVEHNHDSKAV